MTCCRTPSEIGSPPHEHLGCHPFALADQPEEDVFGADVVVAELERLAQGQFEDLLGPRGERDVARRFSAPPADDLLDLVADRPERDAQRVQSLGGDALAFVDQAEEHVFGADVVVAEQRASSCASTTTRRDRSVKRSNTPASLRATRRRLVVGLHGYGATAATGTRGGLRREAGREGLADLGGDLDGDSSRPAAPTRR